MKKVIRALKWRRRPRPAGPRVDKWPGLQMRQDLTDGLRAFAAAIDAHPQVPISRMPAIEYTVLATNDDDGRAELARIAGAFGAQVEQAGTTLLVACQFGGLVFRALYVLRDEPMSWAPWPADRRAYGPVPHFSAARWMRGAR